MARKLFSIYKYKISNRTSSPGRRDSVKTSTSSPSRTSAQEEDDFDIAAELPDLADEGKFTSCMHFYKRDLTPVKENFTLINHKTPYRNSFEHYDINALGKNFKESLISSMGSGVKCQSNTGSDKRITTFSATTETPL